MATGGGQGLAELHGLVGASMKGFQQPGSVFNASMEARGGPPGLGRAVGIGAANTRQGKSFREAAGRHVLQPGVGPVERLNAVEAFDHVAVHPQQAVASRVGQVKQSSALLCERVHLTQRSEVHAGAGGQTEGQGMAGIRRELHRAEDGKTRRGPELIQRLLCPEAVVLREAEAIQPPAARKINKLKRLQRAAGRTRQGVTVEIDDHWRGSFTP